MGKDGKTKTRSVHQFCGQSEEAVVDVQLALHASVITNEPNVEQEKPPFQFRSFADAVLG